MKFSKAILKIHPSGIQVEFWKGETPVFATTIQTVEWDTALALAEIEMNESAQTNPPGDDRSAEVNGVDESINVT